MPTSTGSGTSRWQRSRRPSSDRARRHETMTTETTKGSNTAVQVSIVVDASVERAFEVFTADMGSWWPPEHHILQAELDAMVFEPRVGGHVFDRGVNGSECRWARGLAYEPPRRLVFSWDIHLEGQPQLARRARPGACERGRGPLRRGGTGTHSGHARAPPPRSPSRPVGADARRGRIRRGLAGRPAAVRCLSDRVRSGRFVARTLTP